MVKRTYDPAIFNFSLESLNDDYIIGVYYLKQEAVDHLETTGFMCLESSTGGWIDFPGETREIREKLTNKIVSYFPVPSNNEGQKSAIVMIAFSINGSAGYNTSISMLLTCIAGNILEMPGDIKLIDVIFPKSYINHFKGPKFGVEGIRKIVNVSDQPLVNMMIKPKMGLNAQELKRMSYEAAIGGVDHIKDDEIASSIYNCSLEDRISAIVEGLNEAKGITGKTVIYTPNISGKQSEVFDNARKAIELGATGIMVNIAQGFETLRMLAESEEINVPILFHPAGSPANRSISKIVNSKLARICGADLYLPGSPWAKWQRSEDLESTIRSAQILTSNLYELNKTMIVQSATPAKIPVTVSDYGIDVVVGGGAAIHGHPDGITAGVKSIKQAIELTMKGINLKDRKNSFEELSKALEGKEVFQRPAQTRY